MGDFYPEVIQHAAPSISTNQQAYIKRKHTQKKGGDEFLSRKLHILHLLGNLLIEGEYERRNLVRRMTQSYESEKEKKELNQTPGSDLLDKVRVLQRTLVRMIVRPSITAL